MSTPFELACSHARVPNVIASGTAGRVGHDINATPPIATWCGSDMFTIRQGGTGLHTAWSDTHLSCEMLSGPLGAGVDDLYDPEIGAVRTPVYADVGALIDCLRLSAVVNPTCVPKHGRL
jgi:hypothetical protein